MGIFKRRSSKHTSPVHTPLEPPAPELQWRDTRETPRKNSQIVFYRFDHRFTGEFSHAIVPWGGVWYIRSNFYKSFEHVKAIPTNQIERWAYADGS
jgi:hypothetical protein